jgi:CheY-like chemotaxis protein
MTDKAKVLIIEDIKEMIEFIRFILEGGGFDVVAAQGGQEGLDLVQVERPDLILLDLMMPGIGGWEVYRQLKADDELKDIPVIVVTARGETADRVRGLHVARVDDYIAKPFTGPELLDSINHVLGLA